MNKLVQQEYHDLTGRNYNFYTEKCMETAALQTLNEGGSLGNNKEYFKKNPFIAFKDKYHPFDAANDEYLLEIKRTDKDRNDLYKWGYDFSPDKMKRMVDYWFNNPQKQILILLIHSVRDWRHSIEEYMKTDCKGTLFSLPIKKNKYYESMTRYPRGGFNFITSNHYPLFDYHDTDVFPGPISDWLEEHFTGEKAQKWFKEPFGREKEKLTEKGTIDE